MARAAEPRKKIALGAHGQAPLRKLDILWITAGLGCDGDTIAMTAATQPSIEDIVLGAIPRIPEVILHNPVLAYEVGDNFLDHFHRAAQGKLGPFLLVVEGSIPDETNKQAGYWAAMGTDRATGQPITTCEWLERLAPNAWAIMAAGTCATYGGIHAVAGNPTGCMGVADFLGWDWRSRAGIPIVCVPGCPVQPDNFMETLLYLLYQAAGHAPMIPLDDCLRPRVAVRADRARDLRSRRILRAGRFRRAIWPSEVYRQARMLGSGSAMQCRQTRMDGRCRRMSKCRRDLHWLYDARVP